MNRQVGKEHWSAGASCIDRLLSALRKSTSVMEASGWRLVRGSQGRLAVRQVSR